MKIKLSELDTQGYVKGELAVLEAQRKEASNGPYAMLTLTDGEIDIVGKRWKYDGELPAVGVVLDITAEVGNYQGKKDLNIRRWTLGTTDSEEFRKKGPTNIEEVYKVMCGQIDLIEDYALRSVVTSFYAENKFIMKAPAAKTIHHDYVGGLLQHSFEVLNNTIAIANSMSEATGVEYDYDILRAGAMLHDIGKLHTYAFVGSAIEMTDSGQFLEHIQLGSMIVSEACQKFGVPYTSTLKVLHCIAAHHGQLDWGSPVTPVIPEAFIVHMADNLSAKLTIFENVKKKSSKTWSDKDFLLKTRVYTK